MRASQTKIGRFAIAPSLAGGGYYWRQQGDKDVAAHRYKTQNADQGDIQRTISANGANPTIQVSVGTQVSVRWAAVACRISTPYSRAGTGGTRPVAARSPRPRRTVPIWLTRHWHNRPRPMPVITAISGLFKQGLFPNRTDTSQQAIVGQPCGGQDCCGARVRRGQSALQSVIRSPIDGVVVARNVDVRPSPPASRRRRCF